MTPRDIQRLTEAANLAHFANDMADTDMYLAKQLISRAAINLYCVLRSMGVTDEDLRKVGSKIGRKWKLPQEAGESHLEFCCVWVRFGF